ncbi:hypothetical protein EL22_27510 [Halostagnicola sp. A56]|nr:hypothetical protein EL22_27510 [Halostagnicola sp. A56]
MYKAVFRIKSDSPYASSTSQNNTRIRAGGFYQGPIINLKLTERAAQQIYPEEFSSDEQLFDRQRITDIVNGDI